MCVNGVCTPGAAVVCAMPNPCQNAGTCDPASGTCTYSNKMDGTSCNADNSACTNPDACKAGVCTAGPSVVCASPDACHLPGTCAAASGQCSPPTPAPNTTACTAPSATSAMCDGQGTCLALACSGGLVVDQGVCKKASCMGVACGGPDGAGGTCAGANGNCPAGSGLHCSEAGTCVCDSTSCSGCCSNATTCEPTSMQSTNSCGSGGATCTPCQITNPCLQTVACVNGGCVQSNPIACAAFGQCQMVGACDMTSGKCVYPNKGAGASCNADGNACTTTDTCDGNGGCTPGPMMQCPKPDQCHNAGSCIPASGTCSAPTPAPLGTICTTVQNATLSNCDGAGNCKALTCAQGYVLDQATGTCKVPNCTGAACGASDGAGGKCTGTNGTCANSGQHCNSSGQCVCDGTSCLGGCCDASQQCHAPGPATCGLAGATCKICPNCCTSGGQCGMIYYPDMDTDGQGDKKSVGTCSVSPPAGNFANNNTDCCDTDPNAKVGSHYCSELPTIGCPGWDYDCDTKSSSVGCCQCDSESPPLCSDGIQVLQNSTPFCTHNTTNNIPLDCQSTPSCSLSGGVCTETCRSSVSSACANACTWVISGGCGEDPIMGVPNLSEFFGCDSTCTTPTPIQATNAWFNQACH
jgi:hypothetical protein